MNLPRGRKCAHITGRRPEAAGLPVEQDVDREIDAHIALRTRELVAGGWTEEAARREAVRLFGDPERVGRDCRRITRQHDRRIGLRDLASAFRHDLGFAARLLRRSPLFTAVAVLTLGVAIGANTAIFSVVDSVLLKPLPYPEPDRIAVIWPGSVMSKGMLEEVRDGLDTFAEIAAHRTDTFTLAGEGEAEQVYGGVVSVNEFEMLGARPLLGRLFLPEEQEPGSVGSVVLSYGLWQRRWGGDPGILGRTIIMSGDGDTTRTVVGILSRDFRPLDDSRQVWVPMRIDPSNFPDYQGTASLTVIGRLGTGVTIEQAGADFNRFMIAFQKESAWISEEVARTSTVRGLLEEMVGGARTPMLLLLGAVGLVLLLACTNLANILLARSTNRRREIAVRSSLGASRSRLAGQLVTEGILLGLLGGLAGLGLAFLLIGVLKGNLPADTPRLGEVGIDYSVMLFTGAVALLAGLLSGLLPALRSSRAPSAALLRESERTSTSGHGNLRWNRLLIGLEMALSMVLLVGAGLTLKSIWRIYGVDPGFDSRNLLTLRLSLPGNRFQDEATVREFYRQVTERIEALPAVTSVSSSYFLPMTTSGMGMLYEAEDHPVPEGGQMQRVSVRIVDPSYFRTMRIPLLRGSGYASVTGDQGPFELVINDLLACRLWPDQDPVGNHIEMNSLTWTVVGVVADYHQRRLTIDPVPEVYASTALYTVADRYLLVRTTTDPTPLVPVLREIVAAVDDQVPVSSVRTMEERIAGYTRDARLYAVLMSIFAAAALLLGLVGVYGVVAYAAGLRRRELGIRMTLGAKRFGLVRGMAMNALVPVVIGSLVGLAGAWAASGALASLLYGVSSTDAGVYAGVTLLLLVVAAAASFIPSLRATRLDPMSVLRTE
jgi:putative ABC transport system permease protein